MTLLAMHKDLAPFGMPRATHISDGTAAVQAAITHNYDTGENTPGLRGRASVAQFQFLI